MLKGGRSTEETLAGFNKVVSNCFHNVSNLTPNFILTPKCDHESFSVLLSCGAVCYTLQGGSNVCLKVLPFKWKLFSSNLACGTFNTLYKGLLTFEAVGEILKYDYSN